MFIAIQNGKWSFFRGVGVSIAWKVSMSDHIMFEETLLPSGKHQFPESVLYKLQNIRMFILE